jgi:hypothetical protein
MRKFAVSTIAMLLAAAAISGCGQTSAVATARPPEVAPTSAEPGSGNRNAPAADPFTYGTLRAARLDRTVIVQLGFQQMPTWVNTLTLGLRLDDGSAVYPTTVRSLRNPDRELLASPEVAFRLGRGVIAPAQSVHPTRWIETIFELDAAQTLANGSMFSLLLGDPESVQGCDLGMSVSVSAKDDSPSLYSCILLKPMEGAELLLNLPPAPRPDVPVASFRLSEKSAKADGKVAAGPMTPPAHPVPLVPPSPLVPEMLPPTVLMDLPPMPGPAVSRR